MAPLQKPELTRLAPSVRQLREARNLSQEDLAHAVRDTGGKLTAGSISQIENERIRPERATMEALAAALEVDPRAWLEYRLALGRLWLDERAVGPEQAAENLAQLEDAMDPRRIAMAVLEAETSAAAERLGKQSDKNAPKKPAPRRATQ